MQPWKPDDNPHQARRIGKTAEEVNELGSVLARISIQGMDAIDPSSGKTNRQRFMEETADVMAQCYCNYEHVFNHSEIAQMHQRIIEKCRQMAEWEAHFKDEHFAGHCERPEGCVCGGDTPGVRAACANWVLKR